MGETPGFHSGTRLATVSAAALSLSLSLSLSSRSRAVAKARTGCRSDSSGGRWPKLSLLLGDSFGESAG